MNVINSILRMGRLYKEIQDKPQNAFEMICPDAREFVEKVSH